MGLPEPVARNGPAPLGGQRLEQTTLDGRLRLTPEGWLRLDALVGDRLKQVTCYL